MRTVLLITFCLVGCTVENPRAAVDAGRLEQQPPDLGRAPEDFDVFFHPDPDMRKVDLAPLPPDLMPCDGENCCTPQCGAGEACSTPAPPHPEAGIVFQCLRCGDNGGPCCPPTNGGSWSCGPNAYCTAQPTPNGHTSRTCIIP